jgi:16S rRNA (cytosine1402-N4)-methyltransferase
MRDLDSDIFLGIFSGAPDMPGSIYHVPVMSKQVQASLQPAEGMLFLDGTAGGGGHSALLLQSGAEVICLDQDPQALAACSDRLKEFKPRARFVESNFRDADEALDKIGEERLLNGALLDIGVSSHQLDEAERGFSLMREGPLDMRMSPRAMQSAADVVNTLSAAELTRIFQQYGEEQNARRIATKIVEMRNTHPFKTTFDLVKAVESVSPRRSAKHPATKIFQALRIHVNDELDALRHALNTLPARLAPGARFAVITFHSLEDRIVKVFFREHSREWIDRPEWPKPRRNPDRLFKLLTPHPIAPSEGEMQRNPRSRSAKLRVVEKI